MDESRFLFVAREDVRQEELESDPALELRILGLVDDPHEPLAELLDDFLV